jgi:hypothetical protein
MNEIVIDFADPCSITIEFLAKVPGPELTLGQSTMVFSHSGSFARANALEGGLRAAAGEPPPVEPYPRLMGTGIDNQAADRP